MSDKKCKREFETCDPKPMALPVNMKRPPSLQEQIQRLVRSEQLRQMANASDVDTFEEADDFDVGDDYDPTSPWELEFEPSLGKEITKSEKSMLDASRQKFDEHVKTSQAVKKVAPKEPAKDNKNDAE